MEKLFRHPFMGASGILLGQMFVHSGLVSAPEPQWNWTETENMRRWWAQFGDKLHVTNLVNAVPPLNFKGKPDMGEWFITKTEAKKRGIREFQGRYPLPAVTEGYQLLKKKIEEYRPDFILAVGGHSLWALTGNEGVTKWNGSQIYHSHAGRRIPLVPIVHPALTLRAWDVNYHMTVHDLRTRVAPYQDTPWAEPKFNFITRPSYGDAIDTLTWILDRLRFGPFWLSHDLETKPSEGWIACSSLAWSKRDAICVPLVSHERLAGYWPAKQHLRIVELHRQILSHRNALIVGQNYEYDRQYLLRNWLVKANLHFDTMTGHHVAFPGLPKGLDFLLRLYGEFFVYWKDESKEWQENMDEDKFWNYCNKDACSTYEVVTPIQQSLLAFQQLGVGHNGEHESLFIRKMNLHDPTFHKIQRGVLVDLKERDRIQNELADMAAERAGWFSRVVGYNVNSKSTKPWYNSPQQTLSLFTKVFGCRPVLDKKTKRPTTRDEALPEYASREPLLAPIIQKLQEYRTCNVLINNVCRAKLWHNRLMTQLNIDGPETFRFSSQKNAFGEGTNLQNLTAGTEDDD